MVEKPHKKIQLNPKVGVSLSKPKQYDSPSEKGLKPLGPSPWVLNPSASMADANFFFATPVTAK